MADPAVEKHEELRQAPDAELHQQVEDEEEEGEEEEEEAKEVEAAETDGSIAPPSLGLNSAELATPDKVAPSQELLAAPQGWHKKVGHLSSPPSVFHFHCNLLLFLHRLLISSSSPRLNDEIPPIFLRVLCTSFVRLPTNSHNSTIFRRSLVKFLVFTKYLFNICEF